MRRLLLPPLLLRLRRPRAGPDRRRPPADLDQISLRRGSPRGNRAVADELDHAPTTDEFDGHGLLQSRSLVSRFDSWNEAIEAGLEIARQTDVTCAGVIADIERVAEQLGHRPTRDETIEHGRYTEWQYSRECDSLSAVVERADGVDSGDD